MSRWILVGVLAVFSFALPAQATSIGVTFTGGSPVSANGQGDVIFGYAFTPNQEIQVVSLGVYDDGGNGLSESHDVGLWTNSGGPTILSQTTVPAGTGADLDSSFRFVPITPLTLTSGTTYYLGATDSTLGDVWQWLGTGWGTISPAPEITYVSAAWYNLATYDVSTDDLTAAMAPLSAGDGTGYFGANMQFRVVPEPTTALLVATGLAGLAAAGRRRSLH